VESARLPARLTGLAGVAPGKTEQAALDALAAYAPRYAAVAKLAGVPFSVPATSFKVVETLQGNATTDFGAPGIQPKRSQSL